jgi:hypothetical protein
MTAQDMRFGIIRTASIKGEEVYVLDGHTCPACHWPTEVCDDARRRYCTNKKCNAFVMGEE